ncbi:MAG: hypothetical protein AB8G99_07555 [Planctomycetaceae bacterium]
MPVRSSPKTLLAIVLSICSVLLVGASASREDGSHSVRRLATSSRLPNAIRVHPKVISGGLPDGEAAFEELVQLGVKTVISVDGLKPKVELARRFGLRYVHLPHGYDSIPAGRTHELAKAVLELPGPIYIHCHHGKHRSPAAAVVACVGAGLVKPADGESILRLAGTSRQYRGLYRSVRESKPLSKSVLNRLHVRFQESVPLPPVVETMTKLEATLERLEQFQKDGWKVDPLHPDQTPAHESLQLLELLTEFGRDPDTVGKGTGYRSLVAETDSLAEELHTELAKQRGERVSPNRVLKRIRRSCLSCHERFRD